MAYDLQRFIDAQNAGNAYKNALKEIGNDAFPNHEGMILYCYPNSEAERYGNENGIHVELLEGSGSSVLP